MKKIFQFLIIPFFFALSCNNPAQTKIDRNPIKTRTMDKQFFQRGYSEVNGIKMYYEIYGQGEPIVLLHGGGSTIGSSFGRIIPLLAAHFKVIAPELQNHGHSGFRDIPETFQQDAKDVLALLKNLGINKASFFGFSNGGTTALLLAIHHPEIVHKMVVASAVYKRSGLIPGFFDMMKKTTISQMPPELKAAILKVNPDTTKLQLMFEKDRARMVDFKDIKEEDIKSISAPTLIVNADKDVVRPEHAIELYRLIPNAHLAIFPGIHGEYIGEITTIQSKSETYKYDMPIIMDFLK